MIENCQIAKSRGSSVTRKGRERNLGKRVPVTVTMEREFYDAIEDLVARRVFRDRSHAVNSGLAHLLRLLRENPAAFFGVPPQQQTQQQPQQGQGKDPRFRH